MHNSKNRGEARRIFDKITNMVTQLQIQKGSYYNRILGIYKMEDFSMDEFSMFKSKTIQFFKNIPVQEIAAKETVLKMIDFECIQKELSQSMQKEPGDVIYIDDEDDLDMAEIIHSPNKRKMSTEFEKQKRIKEIFPTAMSSTTFDLKLHNAIVRPTKCERKDIVKVISFPNGGLAVCMKNCFELFELKESLMFKSQITFKDLSLEKKNLSNGDMYVHWSKRFLLVGNTNIPKLAIVSLDGKLNRDVQLPELTSSKITSFVASSQNKNIWFAGTDQ